MQLKGEKCISKKKINQKKIQPEKIQPEKISTRKHIQKKRFPKENYLEKKKTWKKRFEWKKKLNEKRSQTNEKNVCLVKDHTKHDQDHSVSIDMQQKEVVHRKSMHLKLNAMFEKERIYDESTSAHRESLILVP